MKLLIFIAVVLLGIILYSVLGLGGKMGLGLSGLYEGFTEDTVQPTTGVSSSSSTSSSNGITKKTFYGPNGGNAKVVHVNGDYYIQVTDQTGETVDYVIHTSNQYPSPTPTTPDQFDIYGITFTGQYGGKARIINNNGQHIIEITYPSGEILVFTQSSAETYNPNSPNGGTKIISIDPTLSHGGEYPSNSTNAYYYSSSQSSSSIPPESMNAGGQYDSTLPAGIYANQIPYGDEDLYILKSQVVAPVCPACPSCPAGVGGKENHKVPPCPACARCPESNFECKKVPNYDANTNSDEFLPEAILSPFPTFGM